jgi:hypothetical protein
MFSFLSKSSSDGGKKLSKAESERLKMITPLKSTFPSIRRPNNDDSLFEIKFLVDAQYSSLRIYIPSDFPLTRPVLQVAGPLTHPWLDQFKQVAGCQKLMNWNGKTSSLVDVVEESLEALLCGTNGVTPPQTQQNPISQPNYPTTTTNQQPQQQQTPAVSYNNYPGKTSQSISYLTPSSGSSDRFSNHATPQPSPQQPQQSSPNSYHSQYSNYNFQTKDDIAQTTSYSSRSEPPTGVDYSQQQQPVVPLDGGCERSETSSSRKALELTDPNTTGSQKTKLYNESFIGTPDIPQSFPDLDSLTEGQLKRLRDDRAALSAHVTKLAQVESMRQLRDQMRISNHSGLDRNFLQCNELAKLEKESHAAQVQLKAKHSAYTAKSQTLHKEFGVQTSHIVKGMKAKQDKLDESSEDMGVRFVDGEVDLPVFMTDYLEARITYHLMTTKLNVAMSTR